MSMPDNFRPIKWEIKKSNGKDECSECGSVIPEGSEVHVRDARMCSIEAYPNDPVNFCSPCVQPTD